MYKDLIEKQNDHYQMAGSSLAAVGLVALWLGFDQKSAGIALVGIAMTIFADLAFAACKNNRQRKKQFVEEVRKYTRGGILVNQEDVTFTYYELQKELSAKQIEGFKKDGTDEGLELAREADRISDRIKVFCSSARWLGFSTPQETKVIPFRTRQTA